MPPRRRLNALAAAGGLLLTACGSDQTGVNPLAGQTSMGPPASGAVHVQRAGGVINSYAISPQDGRLALVGTVEDAARGDYLDFPRLASNPDGRFLFAASESWIQSYAVGRDGRLSRRGDLSFVSAARAAGRSSCGPLLTESLSASRESVYLVTSGNLKSQTWYAVDVFSVAGDGRLTAQGSTFLGERHRDAGPFLVADPGGRVVYRQKRWDRLVAEAVRPDGTLGGPIAELLMPTGWADFEIIDLIQGFLIVRNWSGSSMASLALDQGQKRLEARPGASPTG